MELNRNSSGMLNGLPKTPKETNKVGPIVGVLVIVLVIIIAVLYFFSQKLNTTQTTDTIVNQNPVEKIVENIPPSNSNDAAVIQADLDAQLKDIDFSF